MVARTCASAATFQDLGLNRRKAKMPLHLISRHPVINVLATPDECVDLIKSKLLKVFEKVRQKKNVRIRRIRLYYDRHVYAAEFKTSDQVWVRNDVVKRGQCRKFT
ncbi:hypothetical protein BpHYR1_025751 [Brachionus plicatilis]|uniref:Uncharacterized protein n=1 Tax=Brachionus plicatilis TaxID=10195 RepID=A0A3M7RNY8_BRAPC|nr:hypothetical protein BpHYR1_025751 [Brachionus plicatilis]